MTYAVRSDAFVYIIIGEEIAIRIPYFIKYIIALEPSCSWVRNDNNI